METIILLTWLVMGMINIILLYYIVKYDPKNVYIGKGWFYEIGLLLIWFSFAFIIIPYYLIRYARKYLIMKIENINNKLRNLKNELEKKIK